MRELVRSRWLALGVALPLLGLSLLIAKAEVTRHSAPSFRIAIEGFDPRDLLYGNYLRYRYRFHWQGPRDCGAWDAAADEAVLTADCCLCLQHAGTEGDEPFVSQVSCERARACDGWLDSTAIQPPLQYFIPEERATELEQALRTRLASVEVRCVNGSPAVGALFLDGQPWREALP